jgi:hypothetical protein
MVKLLPCDLEITSSNSPPTIYKEAQELPKRLSCQKKKEQKNEKTQPESKTIEERRTKPN